MKYNYKNESEKIKDFLLKKFKSGDNPAKEEIYVSIEKIVDQINTLYVIVRNQATKTAIYRGIIMKNISKMDNFMGKKDNLRI